MCLTFQHHHSPKPKLCSCGRRCMAQPPVTHCNSWNLSDNSKTTFLQAKLKKKRTSKHMMAVFEIVTKGWKGNKRNTILYFIYQSDSPRVTSPPYTTCEDGKFVPTSSLQLGCPKACADNQASAASCKKALASTGGRAHSGLWDQLAPPWLWGQPGVLHELPEDAHCPPFSSLALGALPSSPPFLTCHFCCSWISTFLPLQDQLAYFSLSLTRTHTLTWKLLKTFEVTYHEK